MKRRGLFLSDLPSAEWIQYVRDLEDLLHRLRQWDHLDGAHDGPYWKKEIDTTLGDE